MKNLVKLLLISIFIALGLGLSGCGWLWGGLTRTLIFKSLSNGATTTQIYRSVGPGTNAALASGAGNNLTISGSSASFTVALANKIGVGDAIQYQVGGTWYIAFISGRSSSTSYTLQNASGGLPVSTSLNTSWSIYRAYTSLANAVDASSGGTENNSINATVSNFDNWVGGTNLVTANQIWNVAVYADAADSSQTQVAGWTTDATHYIKIYAPYLSTEVGTTQRHSGAWDATKALLSYSNVYIPFEIDNDVWVDGLQILNTENGSTGTFGGISASPSSAVTQKVSNCLIDFSLSGANTYYGIQFGGSVLSATFYAWNNIISNAASASSAGILLYNDGTAYVYNNTVYNFYFGYRTDAGAGGTGNASFLSKNNIAQVCGVGGCFYNANGAVWNPLSDYNICSDAFCPGGTHDLLNKSDTFVNTGSLDFLLAVADTAAKGAGTDLSADPFLPLTTDISSITRTDPWDIGASTPH